MREAANPDAKPEPIRAFLALSLPDSLLEAVGRWQRQALGDVEGVRAIGPDALHLTLAFLGNRTPEEVERATAILTSIEPRPVPLRLEPAPVAVPAGRLRVLAFEVASPGAAALQRQLAGLLIETGLLEPEKRPFWPHLSVARVRRGEGSGALGGPGLGRLPPLAGEALQPVNAVRIALYRSELRTQGARYRSLAAIDLPQKAADEVI